MRRKGTKETVQLAVDLAPELKSRLANQAGAEKRSIKQVVVAALTKYLDEFELFEDAKTKRKPAKRKTAPKRKLKTKKEETHAPEPQANV